MNLEFSSQASITSREAVEALLFFNPQQQRIHKGLLDSLNRFGHPRLAQSGRGLSVRVGTNETQTLFAVDTHLSTSGPVGLIVFTRIAPADIAIIHVSVHPNYAFLGSMAGDGLGLGVILIDQVKEIASRIVGVKRIIIPYRQEVVIPV